MCVIVMDSWFFKAQKDSLMTLGGVEVFLVLFRLWCEVLVVLDVGVHS